MKHLVFWAIVSFVCSLTSCTSISKWKMEQPRLFLEDSVACKASPLCSREVEELLRRSNLFLAAEEYLALRAGDSIKVIATYSRDKSFFPLRREQVKKAFFIYQREGIVCLKEASTLCYEASYPWLQWVWLVYFVVMVIPIMFLMDRIGIDFDSIFFFDAIRFLAIVCSLVYLISSFVTVVVLGEEQCFGYLLLWIFMIQTVGIIVGCITHYLVWRKKRDT